ncbi:MAG: SDR family NAD(P)-dependent oxidoreductase [Candidatus Nanopelagicales bacterium]|jgi:3-hydroxybutyrate dehydrogenase|nr:SDR family oxidoreductase [Candidatus Nanopelagicales bacterium]MCF8558175.1 SDR family oxidoreductase [Candidatus Nanopelagicales bacterium]
MLSVKAGHPLEKEHHMGQLDGRVAVITASTRSIGRGIAEAFHAEGASVVLSGRNPEKGQKAIEEMGGGDRLHFIAADASKQADIEALVDGTAEKFGRVDIVVPNAGGVANTAPVAMMSDEEWQYELDFNINQTFWMARRALKYMVPQQFGRVIGMSSMYGKITTMAVPGYITNKHAIIGFCKALAKEVGTQGITANAICPGFVPTDMFYETGPATVEAMGLPDLDALAAVMYSVTAIQRPNTVEEVAAACVLLASDLGAGISGTTINVDGGASPY